MIACAAALHLLLTVTLFCVGRAQIAPSIVDRDGLVEAVGHDSYDYRRQALGLPLIDQDGLPIPVLKSAHVELLKLEFKVLGPVFGNTILSAEPLNLLCYVMILIVVTLIGREIGDSRTNSAATVIVGLWPTFLLHTTQFLKDPFFILICLALVGIVITWLTRMYTWWTIVISATAIAVLTGCLLLIRLRFASAILGIIIFGFVCLLIRHLLEPSGVYKNLLCPAMILIVAVPMTVFVAARNGEIYKTSSPGTFGASKVDTSPEALTTVLFDKRNSAKVPTPAVAKASQMVAQGRDRIADTRFDFNYSYRNSGSQVDGDIYFGTWRDVVSYLPRAMQIGLWAPFPTMWFSSGKNVGRIGRWLSGAETMLLYLFELLAAVAVFRAPRKMAHWFIVSVFLFGVVALGMVVSNVGALYRLRYLFVIILILVAVKGLEAIATGKAKTKVLAISNSTLISARSTKKKTRVTLGFLCAFAGVLVLSGVLSGVSTRATPNAGKLDFTLINRSRYPIAAIYLSRSDATLWEENLLRNQLNNGQAVTIRFNSQEESSLWDLRLELEGRGIAEWKELALPDISQTIIRISPDEKTCHAWIE